MSAKWNAYLCGVAFAFGAMATNNIGFGFLIMAYATQSLLDNGVPSDR